MRARWKIAVLIFDGNYGRNAEKVSVSWYNRLFGKMRLLEVKGKKFRFILIILCSNSTEANFFSPTVVRPSEVKLRHPSSSLLFLAPTLPKKREGNGVMDVQARQIFVLLLHFLVWGEVD